MLRRFVVMLLLYTGVANPQQQRAERTFPTKDKIQLLLTQSERAFHTYEQAIEQETQAGGKIAQAVPKDREVLTAARDLLARLKKSPDGFNGPAGFLLVGNLDDASRNMSVCMGQAGMESGLQGVVGNVSEGQRYLHLAQTCLDASMLLYTVSETAFDMYSEFLLAQDEMTKRAMSSLEQCVNAVKKNQKQKQ
ncbi:MAG: hypothetical protein ACLPXM_03815 [Terriglobales bacterium]